ncbi:MAG: transglutaminase domain-containing protein [Allomuricauda sp.]
MSKIALSFFILASSFCLGQDYGNVDERVRNYSYFDTIDSLALQIVNDFDSDTEKVRAAFVWLTHNFTYGKTMEDFFKPRPTIIYYSERGKQRQLKKLDDKLIVYAFKNKRGVCHDYSKVLKKLYDKFGLESHIIRGVVKEDVRDITGEKIYKNHAWNAVKLNGEWKLMDPTWASGYYDESRKIQVRKFNERYFDVNPKEFIKDHFPAESKWQLLKEPISVKSFYSAPIYLPGYFESDVELASEVSGLLNQSEADVLLFTFDKFPKNLMLNYSIDSDTSKGRIRRMGIGKRIEKRYVSRLKLRKWLNSEQRLTLYIDKNPILRFSVDE